jgi:Nuclease-related domain
MTERVVTSSEHKLLHLRRDGRCAMCERAMPAGTEAFWVKLDRLVICVDCSCEPPPPGLMRAAAGTAAQREYDKRRQDRIERQYMRYGRIGGWLAEQSQGPQHERAWARGAEGERENARRLEQRLAGEPVTLLHDRHLPGRKANIDHLAIGPSGVMVIDSKKLEGKVRVASRCDLYVDGWKRTEMVEAVERQVELVRGILVVEGMRDVPVRGALCMANPAGLPLLGHLKIREVAIDGTRHIAKLVAEQGGLAAATTETVAAVLDQRLPAA